MKQQIILLTITVLVIIIIFLLHKYYIENQQKKDENMREGLKGLPGIPGIPSIKSIGKDIKGVVKDDPLKEIADFFKRIGNTFKGIKTLFDGIGNEFKYLGIGLKLGFTDVFELMFYVSVFVETYLMCGVSFIANFPKCVFYYFMNTMGQILYLFPRLLLWTMSFFTGNQIYKAEDQIWKAIDKLDRYVYGIASVHIAHWPNNVRALCFNCKRLKPKVLKDKASEIKNDFEVRIPEILNRGINQIKEGAKQISGN